MSETEELLGVLEENEYTDVRLLPTGEYAGIHRMMFTWALCLGLDQTGLRVRWCYETYAEARLALSYFNGEGDPLGMWIVQKPGDRPNPRRSA